MTTGRGQLDRGGRPQMTRFNQVEVQNRLESVAQYGVVEQVDYEKALARVRFSPTRVSNWISWATGNADSGAGNWNPLQEGAQVAVISPSGDQAQGFIIPGVYRDQHRPFSVDKNLYGTKYEDGTTDTHNKATKSREISVPDGGEIVLKVGGVSFRISGAGIDITGGYIKHNGKSIDDQHIHGGVVPGGATTTEPAN